IQFGFVKNTQNKDLPADLNYASVEALYDTLKATYDGELDYQALLDGMKAGLAEAAGDPYTVYLNAEEAKEFNDQLNGTFSGIGAELGQDADKNLIVVSPISGFPAAKAGLRPQDIIMEIDGKTTAGMNVAEAVTKIRGPKGTDVTLRILRNKSEDLTFTITRADIKIPSVKYEILDGNIGYLQIIQFNDDTAELAAKAAKEFKAKGVKGVVLDLRGNPGGLLDAAIDVSSLWLKKGATVLQEKRGGVVVSTGLANGNDILRGVPTVVLINEGSASASEIVAGALKDNKAATIFGVKSFGKGSVQQIKELSGGSELKVTIARWYRPSGENIDGKGISPDKEVKMTEEDYKNGRDPQKDAAIDHIREQ
ncbi:S41 family peptidase, partial [Candidatus Saccharibacteria bacterium]|nr:S41 family peptidase [Candidatus Saccharibacteria bacterium]